MISTLQPRRPQATAPQQRTPLHQQQKRALQTAAPSSQIEAMPPNKSAIIPPTPSHAVSPSYDPATTHPVFFTNSYRRLPFPIPFNAGFSPAATGYVFGDARKRAHSATKL